MDAAAFSGMNMGNMMIDDYGNPYVIIEEQGRRKRAHGLEAHKQNIIAGKRLESGSAQAEHNSR